MTQGCEIMFEEGTIMHIITNNGIEYIRTEEIDHVLIHEFQDKTVLEIRTAHEDDRDDWYYHTFHIRCGDIESAKKIMDTICINMEKCNMDIADFRGTTAFIDLSYPIKL